MSTLAEEPAMYPAMRPLAADYSAEQRQIIVNNEATTIAWPASLKARIREFTGPAAAVASGRDARVGSADESNQGESDCVSNEMWVRRFETRGHAIVGARRCFCWIRRHLFRSCLSGGTQPRLRQRCA